MGMLFKLQGMRLPKRGEDPNETEKLVLTIVETFNKCNIPLLSSSPSLPPLLSSPQVLPPTPQLLSNSTFSSSPLTPLIDSNVSTTVSKSSVSEEDTQKKIGTTQEDKRPKDDKRVSRAEEFSSLTSSLLEMDPNASLQDQFTFLKERFIMQEERFKEESRMQKVVNESLKQEVVIQKEVIASLEASVQNLTQQLATVNTSISQILLKL